VTRRLELTEAERATLEQAVKHHPKPYVRERASALIKVANRAVASGVAEHGLLVRHAPDTVYRWLDRYEAEGIAALTVRPGRGRKARLSPPRGRGAGRAARRAAAAARE
jgi:hypothetical protein